MNREKWTIVETNTCVVTKGTGNFSKVLRNLKREKNYDNLKKRADAAADEKAKYDAQLLQAFKDKKLKSKSLIKEAQLLKKAEDKKLKAKKEKIQSA